MHTREYKKVKELAHEQVEILLNDKKALLIITIFSVLQAFKLNPENQILISNFSNAEDNPSYFAERQKNELLGLAEMIQDQLTNNPSECYNRVGLFP